MDDIAHDLPRGDVAAAARALARPGDLVEVGGRRLPIHRTYGDAASGEALALVDSEGWIEVAVRDGSAAERLALAQGSAVRLRRP